MAKGRKNNNAGKGIVALLVVGVITAGVCCMGYASRNDAGKWFGNGDLKSWHWTDESEYKPEEGKPEEGKDFEYEEQTATLYSDEMFIEPGERSSLMALQVAALAADSEEATEYDSITVTATVLDEYGKYYESLQAVTWTIAYENGGEVPADVMTLTVEGNSVTVTCLQSFSTKIILKCTSDLNEEAYATKILQYGRRAESVYAVLNGQTVSDIVPGTIVTAIMPRTVTRDEYWSNTSEWAKSLFVFGGVNYGEGTTAIDHEAVFSSETTVTIGTKALTGSSISITLTGEQLRTLYTARGAMVMRFFLPLLLSGDVESIVSNVDNPSYFDEHFPISAVQHYIDQLATYTATRQFTINAIVPTYGGTKRFMYYLSFYFTTGTASDVELDDDSEHIF